MYDSQAQPDIRGQTRVELSPEQGLSKANSPIASRPRPRPLVTAILRHLRISFSLLAASAWIPCCYAAPAPLVEPITRVALTDRETSPIDLLSEISTCAVRSSHTNGLPRRLSICRLTDIGPPVSFTLEIVLVSASTLTRFRLFCHRCGVPVPQSAALRDPIDMHGEELHAGRGHRYDATPYLSGISPD